VIREEWHYEIVVRDIESFEEAFEILLFETSDPLERLGRLGRSRIANLCYPELPWARQREDRLAAEPDLEAVRRKVQRYLTHLRELAADWRVKEPVLCSVD
jgi:hypothetical protein